jgi:dTDP-4-dehydrorhamnose reductase
MATVLLFGAHGQLGTELREEAARRGIDLHAANRADTDIADAEAVRRVIEAAIPAVVVNAAAYTKVDRAETESELAFRANALGPKVLAELCAARALPLLHVSTDFVFDGKKPSAYVETDPVAPLGVYGRSKAEGETAIRAVLERHIILRTSWVYGIYGANFLKTVLRLASERNELRIVADQRGCPTGTADLAEAILTIAALIARGDARWGLYHFAGQGATTWHGFAEEIVRIQAPFTGRRPAVIPITTAEYPTPAIRPANSALDSGRFAATFGIKAKHWRDRTREVATALLR